MLFDIRLTPAALKAAAEWCVAGENVADVELLVDDRMLLVGQGDERAAFDTGGEPGSAEYLAAAPLDRGPAAKQAAAWVAKDAVEVLTSCDDFSPATRDLLVLEAVAAAGLDHWTDPDGELAGLVDQVLAEYEGEATGADVLRILELRGRAQHLSTGTPWGRS